jgi:hypothetical protein
MFGWLWLRYCRWANKRPLRNWSWRRGLVLIHDAEGKATWYRIVKVSKEGVATLTPCEPLSGNRPGWCRWTRRQSFESPLPEGSDSQSQSPR